MNAKHDTEMDKALQQAIVETLEDSIEHLDANTLSRLNQARHNALALAERPRLISSQWLKAGTFAVLLATVINAWLFFSSPDIPQMNTDDLELIVNAEDFELMQELDFVAWMIEQEHAS